MDPSQYTLTASKYVNLLAQVPFLSKVPFEDLEPLAERSVVRRFDAGQNVISQGQFGHSMYVVINGNISMYAEDENGERLFLGQLNQSGHFFGEEALLGRGVRTATATTEGPSVLLEIERNRFDLVARRHEIARRELENFYHARAIATYTRLHRYLGQLDDQTIGQLIVGATMRKFQRNDVVCQASEPSNTVMLVKDGVLKMVRTGQDGRLSILAYFNNHDVAGAHDPQIRGYDLIALGQAEVIFLDRRMFDRLQQTHAEIHARFGKDDMRRQGAMAAAGDTIIGVAQAFLTEGVEVESLLVINLDRCVRCGNCVRACHARHEFTRLDRRGPIFRRRKAVTSQKHEHVLIPSSCRHCRDPECMIGCPTGAIQRFPNGDVDINDNCIGCDNCARKCPYGNITMRPLPEEQQTEDIKKRAIKCTLCRGYSYANCVHECPRGAILRVDPLRYFDELTMVMEPEQIEAIQAQNAQASQDSKHRIRPRSTAFIGISLAIFVLGIAGILAGYFMSPEPRSGRTAWGIGFGIGAASCIVIAMFLGARKRMRNIAIGPLEVWTQFHMVVGLLGFVAALAHAGFAITGIFTTLLLAVFAVEVLTGVIGQAIYMTVPRMLSRLERNDLSKLIEDLIQEELELDRGITELTQASPAAVQSFVHGALNKAAGGTRLRLSKSYDSTKLVANVRQLIGMHQALLDHRTTAERLIEDTIKLRDLRAQIALHRSMKVWLIVHIATTGALGIFLAAHIAAMLLIIL